MKRTVDGAITQGAGGPVDQTSLVVVYDRQTGVIVHVHQAITIKGGRHPEKREIEVTALGLARRRADKGGELSTLHVDPRRVKFGVHYEVDLRKRALKQVPGHRSTPPLRGGRG